MAGRTTNYGWMKPETNDYLEIGVISEVFEAIDSQIKAMEEAMGDTEALDNHIEDKENPHEVTAEQVGAAEADTHILKTYAQLEEIGLTVGMETIESIANNMPDLSILIQSTGEESNIDAYPENARNTSGVPYGTCIVVRHGSRVSFKFIGHTTGRQWIGSYYRHSTSPLWSGWEEVATSGNLSTQIQNLLSGGEISMVKSLQRGVVKADETYKDVTINAVDMNKAFVNVQPFMAHETVANGVSTSYAVVGKLTSSTNLRVVTTSKYTSYEMYWEVVEFY